MTHTTETPFGPLTARLHALESQYASAAHAADHLNEIAERRRSLQDQLADLDREEAETRRAQADALEAETVLASVKAVLDGRHDMQAVVTELQTADAPAPAPQEPVAAAPEEQTADAAQEPESPAPGQPAPAEDVPQQQPEAPSLSQSDRVLAVITEHPWLTVPEISGLLPDIKNLYPAVLAVLSKGQIKRINNAQNIYIYAATDVPEPEAAEQPVPQEVAQAKPAQVEVPAQRVPDVQTTPQPAQDSQKLPAHLRPIPANVQTDAALRASLVQLASDQGGRAMSESFYIGRLTKKGAYRGAEVTAAIRECVEAGSLRVVNGDKYALNTAVKA